MLLDVAEDGVEPAPMITGLSLTDGKVLLGLEEAATAMEGLSTPAVRRAAATLLDPGCLALLEIRLQLPRPDSAHCGWTQKGDRETPGPHLELLLELPRAYPELEPPRPTLYSDESGKPPDSVLASAAKVTALAVTEEWKKLQGAPCLGEILTWAKSHLPILLWGSESTWLEHVQSET